MQAVGVNPDTGLVEVVEVANHPWFVGTQYHPEYKSTVLKPHRRCSWRSSERRSNTPGKRSNNRTK